MSFQCLYFMRIEEICIEDELEMLENKEYDRLKKKLERDLKS